MASVSIVPRSPPAVESPRSLSVGEISGIIKGVSVLSDRELSMVSVLEVDDDDDLSSQTDHIQCYHIVGPVVIDMLSRRIMKKRIEQILIPSISNLSINNCLLTDGHRTLYTR